MLRAAANGLAKILNGSKDPVLVRHVVDRRAGSISVPVVRRPDGREGALVETDALRRAAPHRVAPVWRGTTGDIRKHEREKEGHRARFGIGRHTMR